MRGDSFFLSIQSIHFLLSQFSQRRSSRTVCRKFMQIFMRVPFELGRLSVEEEKGGRIQSRPEYTRASNDPR